MTTRSALYVDGFNLYHAVDDLQEPFLKWCNLWKLGEILIPTQSERLVRAVFCTAYYPGDSKKRWRHDQYMNALRLSGVECVLGHYVHERQECRSCGSTWQKPTEKETDINVALTLMNDGWQNLYDTAYLLTQDSDQAATVKAFRNLFPDKRLVTVAPPERNFSLHIQKLAHARIALTKEHLERALLPPVMPGAGPLPAARRPREYDPPDWWVTPEKRPQ